MGLRQDACGRSCTPGIRVSPSRPLKPDPPSTRLAMDGHSRSIDMQQLKSGEVNLGVRPRACRSRAALSLYRRRRLWPCSSRMASSSAQTRAPRPARTSCAVLVSQSRDAMFLTRVAGESRYRQAHPRSRAHLLLSLRVCRRHPGKPFRAPFQ